MGGPDIQSLVNGFLTPGQLSVEFVNVGGCLTHGDLALDSCAQFLAVAEHWLIPSRARSVCHQLREACHHSVWSLAVNSTPHTSHFLTFSHLITRTCVAQAISLACAHHSMSHLHALMLCV